MLLLWIPAACDLTGTTVRLYFFDTLVFSTYSIELLPMFTSVIQLMNIGLLYTPVSIYQVKYFLHMLSPVFQHAWDQICLIVIVLLRQLYVAPRTQSRVAFWFWFWFRLRPSSFVSHLTKGHVDDAWCTGPLRRHLKRSLLAPATLVLSVRNSLHFIACFLFCFFLSFFTLIPVVVLPFCRWLSLVTVMAGVGAPAHMTSIIYVFPLTSFHFDL